MPYTFRLLGGSGNGGGGDAGGVAYNSNYNILDEAISDTDLNSFISINDKGRVSKAANSTGYTYILSKHLVPAECYFEVEYTNLGNSDSAITHLEFSPKLNDVRWEKGFVISTDGNNLIFRQISSGSRPRDRVYSSSTLISGVISSGDVVRYWLTKIDNNTINVNAQVNGVGQVYSQNIPVTGIDNTTAWAVSLNCGNSSSDVFDVTYNFGFKEFTYTPEAGKGIAALSPAINTTPFNIWTGSAILVAQSAMDFPVSSPLDFNRGSYIVNSTPVGGSSSDSLLYIRNSGSDSYSTMFGVENTNSVWVDTSVQWDGSAGQFKPLVNSLNLSTGEITQGVALLNQIAYKFEG